MSQVLIAKAFEDRLDAMTPALSTAKDNTNFTPVVGTPYQETALLPAAPDNSTQGATHFKEIGLFQVMLCYPKGTGAGDARARAELIKTQFKRGTTMTESGLTIIVISTPTIAPAFIDGDRYKLPVSIFYQCDVNL